MSLIDYVANSEQRQMEVDQVYTEVASWALEER